MGFSRQEYFSPSPGDLPDPGHSQASFCICPCLCYLTVEALPKECTVSQVYSLVLTRSSSGNPERMKGVCVCVCKAEERELCCSLITLKDNSVA